MMVSAAHQAHAKVCRHLYTNVAVFVILIMCYVWSCLCMYAYTYHCILICQWFDRNLTFNTYKITEILKKCVWFDTHTIIIIMELLVKY